MSKELKLPEEPQGPNKKGIKKANKFQGKFDKDFESAFPGKKRTYINKLKGLIEKGEEIIGKNFKIN